MANVNTSRLALTFTKDPAAMFTPAKVVLLFLISTTFLLQGCSSTGSGESKCPFARLVQTDKAKTAEKQEAPAKPDSQQQAH